MKIVLLRFDAPLMSFGSVVVDHHNRTDRFPYRAMLTGLIANALGWNRREHDREHDAIQQRLAYAARRDRPGEIIVDYQTVDFDPEGPMSAQLGWTTWGHLELRRGGDASEGTHIRYRHYLADAIVTVALTLDRPDESPSLQTVGDALREPARPLFVGRKCCIPSVPIFLDVVEAEGLRSAIEQAPRAARGSSGALPAIWPAAGDDDPEQTRKWPRVEDRDWVNSIHVGRHFYSEGLVTPPETVR